MTNRPTTARLPDDLELDCYFLRDGDPWPTAWVAAHPGWFSIPATLQGAADGGEAVRPRPKPPAPDFRDDPVVAQVAMGPGDVMAAGMVGGAAAGVTGGMIGRWLGLGATPPAGEIRPFAPPPSTPPNSGLVPPDPGAKPGEGGLTPSAGPPAPEGFTAAPPSPVNLPGADLAEPDITVLDTRRNEGLEGGARTGSVRAREAARISEPAVTAALADQEWRAHHLINLASIRQNKDLVDAAVRAGWRTDAASNVVPLPATVEAREKLRKAGAIRPVHDSRHEAWNGEVAAELADVKEQVERDGHAEGSVGYDQAVRQALERIPERMRTRLLESNRVTQNDAQTIIT